MSEESYSPLIWWAEAVDLLLQLPPRRRAQFLARLAGELLLPDDEPAPSGRHWQLDPDYDHVRIVGL